MLHKLLVASAAAASISAFLFVSQPVEAGSCSALQREGNRIEAIRDLRPSPQAIAPESQSLGQEERLQEGLGQQDIDELQEEGRAVSLHRRRQGVRQLIHQSGLAKAGDAIVT